VAFLMDRMALGQVFLQALELSPAIYSTSALFWYNRLQYSALPRWYNRDEINTAGFKL
jgi:hypothetical protein